MGYEGRVERKNQDYAKHRPYKALAFYSKICIIFIENNLKLSVIKTIKLVIYMAKVKCDHCDSFIDDTQEKCPICGANNSAYQRIVSDTPKTIEQLQSWYRARKLPPEETTRFFIGKDIKEPKAFGIYQKGDYFIVYKNKANGQRAIRYEGKDEAYAVNEIYLKLKEEILRQKNINHNRRQQNNSYQSDNRQDYKPRKKHRYTPLLYVFLPVILSVVFIISVLATIGAGLFIDSGRPANYYLSSDKQLYYSEGLEGETYDWWLYDYSTKEWNSVYNLEEDEYPPQVEKDNVRDDIYAIAEELNLSAKEIDIYNSKKFIDAGNHKTPTTSYYRHGDKLYYFLDDTHGNYGKDNSGWYIFQNNDWEYYCSEDDRTSLGDDLWYYARDYSLGSSFSAYDWEDDGLSDAWNPTNFKSFEDTSWYKSYESNNSAYERDMEEQRNDDNDWDSDSDWDWDDNDDWDSDYGDWDSDW